VTQDPLNIGAGNVHRLELGPVAGEPHSPGRDDLMTCGATELLKPGSLLHHEPHYHVHPFMGDPPPKRVAAVRYRLNSLKRLVGHVVASMNWCRGGCSPVFAGSVRNRAIIGANL
jgi:hypothetical protein